MNVILRSTDQAPPDGKQYFLSDVILKLQSGSTAVFRATLNGPPGAEVWARAWLSSEIDGTLAESASECMKAGEIVALVVKLKDERQPENAFMRIESAPLATEQVVMIKLPPNGMRAPMS
jgi:hypothetical protein